MHSFKSSLLDFSYQISPSEEWFLLKNCQGIQVPEHLYSPRCDEGALCADVCRSSGASRLCLMLLLQSKTLPTANAASEPEMHRKHV